MSSTDDMPIGCAALIAGLTVLALVAAGVIGVMQSFGNERTDVVCTVTDKDRSSDGDGNSKYRIYTRECGVLSDEDDTLRGKYNSADVYAALEADHTYRLHLVGYRMPFWSAMPNILGMPEDITPAPTPVMTPAPASAGH